MNKKAIAVVHILFLTVTFNSPGEKVQYEMQAVQDMTFDNPFLSEEFIRSPMVQDRDPASRGKSKEISMKAYNWGFSFSPIEIRSEDRVKITVESTEGIHGLFFPQMGINTGPVVTDEVSVIEFVVSGSSDIIFGCNIPCGNGHYSMNGQLRVLDR
ncbi:MAG TPA: hypothetical protein ENI27_06620 [bacterium]|nr:hypothetical protein [bacterium]